MRLRSLPTRLRRGRARVLVVAAAILACAGAVGLFTAWAGLTGRAEQQSLDWRWQLRGHQSPDRRLAMVAMDDESLQRLGFTWPISRHDEARVLTALGETGASTVVYMVGFDMPGPSRTQDGELLDAMAGVPGLVLPAVHADADGPRFLGGGKANREQSGAVFGGDLEVRDDDGAVRRLAVDDEPLGLATVPIVAAEHALRHPVRAPGARPWLDLPSAPCALNAPAGSDGRLRCSMPAYTLRALLAGRIPADALTDKVVVVAYTGSDLQTLRQTWAGGARLATSGELLAHEIGTALRDFPLRSTAWWWTALATLLLCCVPVGAGGAIDLRLRTRIRQPSWIASAALVVVAGLAALVLGAGAAALAFGAWGRVVPVAAPAACVLVATGLAAARAGALVRARAGDVWRTAGSLAPEQLVARIIEDTRGRGLLTSPLRRARGAEHAPGTVEMTILFADLRDSTTYVMALDDPTQTWAFSQAFMQHAITAIENHGGYAQSLEGDGLLAMFGPWYGGEDHAGLAITAALDLTGPALEAIRAQLADGLAVEAPRLGAVLAQRPLGLRVAVHSGEVHYGTSGRVDGDAMRYSASTVGQTTHLAAKLRAVAAPSKRERWDRDSQAALFERDSTEWAGADERIVVVSEETMAAARREGAGVGLQDGFVRAWVTPVDLAVDMPVPWALSAPEMEVWVHQRLTDGRPLHGAAEPAGSDPLDDGPDPGSVPGARRARRTWPWLRVRRTPGSF